MNIIFRYFRPPTLVVLFFIIGLQGNKGNAQCSNPIIYNDWPFTFDLDVLSSNSQLIFEGFECNPCLWETLPGDFDEDWPTICDCYTYWENQYGVLLQECYDQCREYHGGFEYNYALLHACEQQCHWDVLTQIVRGKDNCGDFPAPNQISNYQFTVLFWYTTNPIELGSGFRPPDDFYISSNNTGALPPKEIKFTTDVNLSGQNLSYCIRYEMRINMTDGTCCYFYGYQCWQQ